MNARLDAHLDALLELAAEATPGPDGLPDERSRAAMARVAGLAARGGGSRLRRRVRGLERQVDAAMSRPPDQPVINVHPPSVHVAAPVVHVHPPAESTRQTVSYDADGRVVEVVRGPAPPPA